MRLIQSMKSPTFKSSFLRERGSTVLPFSQKLLFGQDHLQLTPKHIKIRANEEFVDDEVLPKLRENPEGFVTLDRRSFPVEVKNTALCSQIHPGGFARDLYSLTYKALKETNKQLAKRLFVQLQVDRGLYHQKEESNRPNNYTMATWVKRKLFSGMIEDVVYGKKVYSLFNYALPLPANLPVRKQEQPFLITIGFVPETENPLTSK